MSFVLLGIAKGLAPTILTLLVGTFWLNRLFVARSNFAALIERVCNSLDALSEDCAKYWSIDYSDDKATELGLLEAKIKGRVVQISYLINLIQEKRKHMTADLQKYLVDMADVCTGGTFETKGRKKDIGRYMKVVATSNKIAVELLRLKIWTSRLGEFIDEICTRPVISSARRPEI